MATLHGVQGSPSESSGDTRRNVSWNVRRRSSRAGALELPAGLIHVPMPEVPQNGVASRWSRVTPIAGSLRQIPVDLASSANCRDRRTR